MTKRIKSFSATQQVEQILDDLNWGEKSAFINTAILKHVKNGEPEEKEQAEERAKTEPSTTRKTSSGGNEKTKPSEKTEKHSPNQLSILLKKLDKTNHANATGGST